MEFGMISDGIATQTKLQMLEDISSLRIVSSLTSTSKPFITSYSSPHSMTLFSETIPLTLAPI
jgi:hypothetical protein